MAQFDLNRAQDTPIATLLLNETPPGPAKVYPVALDATPEYVPVFTYEGGAPNTAPYTPVEHGTANVVVDDRGAGDYMPRTQADKAIALGVGYADPINTPFGYIEPRDPYPTAGFVPPVTPVITTLTPATAVIGQPSIVVVITGTGFTPYSEVEVGGTNYADSRYVSPTEMRFYVDTLNSQAGTISVKVLDHNVKSAAANFVFTAPA